MRQLVYCSNHGGLMSLQREKAFICSEQANWMKEANKHGVYAVSWCLVKIKTGRHLKP